MQSPSYKDFSSQLRNLDLAGLIRTYPAFEAELKEELSRLCIVYMEAIATRIAGENYYIQDLPLRLGFSSPGGQRNFEVLVHVDDVNYKAVPLSMHQDVAEIGLVGQIILHYPRGFRKKLERLLTWLSEATRFAYTALETALRTRFHEHNLRLTQNIYERIEMEIKKAVKPQLIGQYWLSVTRKTGYGPANENALIFFNPESLVAAIALFKKNQARLYSPFDLLTALMFEEVPDEGMEQFKQDKKEVRLEFSKMSKGMNGFIKFWNAEKVLLPEKSFRFIYVSHCKGYILAVNYVDSMADDFRELIMPVAADLDRLFTSNINENKVLFGIVKKIISNSGNGWDRFLDFLSTFMAKYGAEMTKQI